MNQVVTTSFLLRPANSQLLGGGNKTGAILNDSIHSEIECVLWVTFPRAATQKIESLRPLRKDTLVTTWFKKMPDFLPHKCEPNCDSKKCEKVRGRKHKSLSPPEVWGSCRLFFLVTTRFKVRRENLMGNVVFSGIYLNRVIFGVRDCP